MEEISTADELKARLEEVARERRHERVLVEVSGLTQVSYWMRSFAGSSGGEAFLEQVVVVIDLVDFHRTVVAPRGAGPHPGLLNFHRALIGCATVLMLNKCDLAGDAEREAATRHLRGMNPSARIIETAYGEVPPDEILKAPQSPAAVALCLRRRADGPAMPACESVVYRAHRPFHPQRLWDWFEAPHPGLLRVKGLVWLATRNLLVGGISRTVWQNSCGAAGIWWAALPREEWPSDPEVLWKMQKNWREPFGDRRQELVLVGERGADLRCGAKTESVPLERCGIRTTRLARTA